MRVWMYCDVCVCVYNLSRVVSITFIFRHFYFFSFLFLCFPLLSSLFVRSFVRPSVRLVFKLSTTTFSIKFSINDSSGSGMMRFLLCAAYMYTMCCVWICVEMMVGERWWVTLCFASQIDEIELKITLYACMDVNNCRMHSLHVWMKVSEDSSVVLWEDWCTLLVMVVLMLCLSIWIEFKSVFFTYSRADWRWCDWANRFLFSNYTCCLNWISSNWLAFTNGWALLRWWRRWRFCYYYFYFYHFCIVLGIQCRLDAVFVEAKCLNCSTVSRQMFFL